MARRNVQTLRAAATAAAAAVTLPAPIVGSAITGQRWRILKASGSYSTSGGGGTGVGTLRITADPAGTPVVLWELDVDIDGGIIEDFLSLDGLQCPPDVAVKVEMLTGGAGVTAKVNVAYALEH